MFQSVFSIPKFAALALAYWMYCISVPFCLLKVMGRRGSDERSNLRDCWQRVDKRIIKYYRTRRAYGQLIIPPGRETLSETMYQIFVETALYVVCFFAWPFMACWHLCWHILFGFYYLMHIIACHIHRKNPNVLSVRREMQFFRFFSLLEKITEITAVRGPFWLQEKDRCHYHIICAAIWQRKTFPPPSYTQACETPPVYEATSSQASMQLEAGAVIGPSPPSYQLHPPLVISRLAAAHGEAPNSTGMAPFFGSLRGGGMAGPAERPGTQPVEAAARPASGAAKTRPAARPPPPRHTYHIPQHPQHTQHTHHNHHSHHHKQQAGGPPRPRKPTYIPMATCIGPSQHVDAPNSVIAPLEPPMWQNRNRLPKRFTAQDVNESCFLKVEKMPVLEPEPMPVPDDDEVEDEFDKEFDEMCRNLCRSRRERHRL